MKVKEIMVKEVATLDVNDELSLANDIMRLGRIRHLPVVDGTRLVGIVSERDLFRSLPGPGPGLRQPRTPGI